MAHEHNHEKHCGTSIGGPCDCDKVREREYSGILFAAQAAKLRASLRDVPPDPAPEERVPRPR